MYHQKKPDEHENEKDIRESLYWMEEGRKKKSANVNWFKTESNEYVKKKRKRAQGEWLYKCDEFMDEEWRVE